MSPKLLIELAQEAPGVVLIFICWFVYRELKKHGKAIENLVTKDQLKEVKDDIDEINDYFGKMKLRVTWKDVFDPIIEDIKRRVTRIEDFVNGSLK